MAQRPVAGKGRLARLAVMLLAMLLVGCAGQPGASRQAGSGLAGDWIRVQRGDTLGAIARRAEVPLVRLRRFNPDVDPRRLAVGQRLLVPSHQERAPAGGPYRYQIRPGDTFSAIARHFATRPARLQAANPGVSPTALRIGQLIQVPLAGPATATSTATSRVGRPAAPPAAPAGSGRPDPGPSPTSAGDWPWPLADYRVARGFGPDARGTLQPMLLATGEGARARAVADGEVRFADAMRQLGQVVIVHHANNLQSVYALCESLLVDAGRRVRRGTPLCEVGRRGDSGRFELLFDMRHGGKPIDPATVLH